MNEFDAPKIADYGNTAVADLQFKKENLYGPIKGWKKDGVDVEIKLPTKKLLDQIPYDVNDPRLHYVKVINIMASTQNSD